MSAFSAEIKLNLDVSNVLAQIDRVNASISALERQQVRNTQAAVGGLSTFSASGIETTAAQRAEQENVVLATEAAKLRSEGNVILAAANGADLEMAAAARGLATSYEEATKQVVYNAGDRELLAATAELALARRLQAANASIATNNVLLGDNALGTNAAVLSTEGTNTSTLERAKQSESINRIQAQLVGAEASLLDQVTIETVGREAFNAKLAEASVVELRAKEELAVVTAAAVKAQVLADEAIGVQTTPQLAATAAYDQQFVTLKEKNALLRLQLNADEEMLKLQEENVILAAEYAAVQKERIAAATGGVAATATTTAVADTGASGGGVIGSFGGVAGLAKFALGAAAFATVSAGIIGVLKESAALQSQLSILQSQLAATDRAGDFPTLKAGLLEISRQTGVNTSDLAKLAITISGTFQGSAGARGTPQFVLDQVKSAGELQKVYGLSASEIQQSVTALAYTFETNFQKIGDKAAGLQARFGTSAKEIITSVSQIAPIAKEMGLSFDQVATITASAERVTGRTGVSVTEALGRVLPNIAQKSTDILSVFAGNKALADQYDKVVTDIASGQTGKVLIDLIQNWSKLSQVQRDTLLFSLGGGRQAPQLAAVFGDPQLLSELNKPIDDQGKLADQFKKIQDTFSQAAAQFKQQLIQLGIALSGSVLPVLKDLLTVVGAIITVLAPVAAFIGTLASAFDGLGAKVLTAVIALKALQAAQTALLGEQGLVGISSLLSGNAIAGKAGIGGLLGKILPGFGASAGAGAAATEGGVLAGETAAGGAGVAAGGAALLGTPVGWAVVGTAIGVAAISAMTAGVPAMLDKIKAQTTKDVTSNPAYALAVAEGRSSQFNSEGSLNPASGKGGLFGNIYDATQFLTGEPTRRQQVQDTAQKGLGQQWLTDLENFRRDHPNVGNSNKQGQVSGGDIGEQLSALAETGKGIDIKAIDPTDDTVFKQLKTIRADIIKKYGANYFANLKKKIDEQNKPGTESNYALALAGGNADNITNAGASALDNTKAAYQAGTISYTQYIDQLNQSRQGVLDVIAKSSGDTLPRLITELTKWDNEVGKATSDAIKKRLDLAQKIAVDTGHGNDLNSNGDLASVSADVAALQDPKFTDLTDRAAVTNDIFTNLKKQLQDRINAETTAAGKLAVATQGVPVPYEAQLVILQQILDGAIQATGQLGSQLATIASIAGETLPKLENDIISLSRYLGISETEATRLILEQMLQQALDTITNLGNIMQYTNKANKTMTQMYNAAFAKGQAAYGAILQLNTLSEEQKAAFDKPPDITRVVGDTSGLQAAADNSADIEAKAYAKAQGAVLKAQAGGDPVLSALADIQAADLLAADAAGGKPSEQLTALAAQITAHKAFETAIKAIENAKLDFLKALVGKDSLEVARLTAAQDYGLIFSAVGEAAQLQAAATAIAALKDYQQKQFDATFGAVFAVQDALAKFAGDTFKSAQLGLAFAQQKLLLLKQQGGGPIEIASAQASIINAQANLRDTQLKESEATVDFNLQTKAISTAQAIAAYQALLNNADIMQLTVQERRDLILKIQALKNTLTQNLQFDLPTDLKLPTLYEARRVSEAGTAGSYQDNRNVVITLNSTDPASTAAAVNQINDALNAPPVFGTVGHIY